MKTTEAKLLSLVIFLNRITLGLLFALAGVRKLMPFDSLMDNWSGFAGFTASKAPLPEFMGKAYGYALPPVEILVGALLVLGIYTRLSAVAIALMLVSFLIAMGPEFWPESGPAFSKNFILLSLALMLAVAGSGKLAVRPDGPLSKGGRQTA